MVSTVTTAALLVEQDAVGHGDRHQVVLDGYVQGLADPLASRPDEGQGEGAARAALR
jgi:hypothetical protein